MKMNYDKDGLKMKENCEHRKNYKVIFFSLVLTLFLAVSMSVTLFKDVFCASADEDLTITITAAAEKSEDSWGTDVRIGHIIVNRTTQIDLNDLASSSTGWFMDGNMLCSYGPQQEASLTVNMENAKSIYIRFYGQEGSGFVKIECGDVIETIDLYRDQWASVGWDYKVQTNYTLEGRIGLLALIWVLAECAFLVVWQLSKRKYIAKAINLSFGLMIVSIIIISVAFSNWDYAYKRFSQRENLIIIGIIAIVELLIFACISKKILPVGKTIKVNYSHDKFVKVSAIILFLIQIYVAYNIFFKTGWDAGAVMSAAEIYAFGAPEDVLKMYNFSRYPNNLLIMLIYSVILKINNAVGVFIGEYQFMSVVVLNAAINSCTCFLVYKTAKLFVPPAKAVIAFLVSIAAFGISPWTVVCYTDSIGLIFPLLCFYLYAVRPSKKWMRIAFLLLSIVVGSVGYFIKPQCMLLLVAIAVVEFAKFIQEKQLKQLRFSLFILAGMLICFVGVKQSIEVTLGNTGISLDTELKCDWSHVLAMGLNEQTSGTYSQDDVDYSDIFLHFDVRREANLNKAVQRLKNMGPAGILRHAVKKILVTFNDGTCAWGMEGTFFQEISDVPNDRMADFLRSVYYTDGEHFGKFAFVAQLIWLTLLQLALCASIHRRGHGYDERISILMLSIIGLTLFELLFEVRARYIYTYVPVLCVLAIIGESKLEAAFRFRSVETIPAAKGRHVL